MRIFFKLCRSIVRKNKGFTAGIFIMSVLSAAIAFLGANFAPSGSDTVMNFISKSGTPDAVYLTDILPGDTRGDMEAIQGVDTVSPGFIFDTNMETSAGELYSVRLFRTEADSPFINTVHAEAEYAGDLPCAAISNEFAEYNGILPGDMISLSTPFGKKDVIVQAVISNPETMSCVKDEMSAYENYQFVYLFLNNADFDLLFHTQGASNRWLIYFEDGLSREAQDACMQEIRALLGSHLVSETFTAESEAMNIIRDDLHTIGVLCSFIPGIILLISLGFNFIFIKIIIENQRKTIGLLRALGYSVRKVVFLFISYTVFVNLPALALGIWGGSRLLLICLALIAEGEGITQMTVTILPGVTAAMLGAVLVIGIAAALLTAGTISKIDPAEAYGGVNYPVAEPPAFLRRLRAHAFLKLSIVSSIRNYKRQIIGALCIAACIISMCIGFEGVLTIGYPIHAVYGGRYRYDLMVRNISGDAADKIASELSGAQLAEPASFFSAVLLGKEVKVSTLREDAQLTVLTDASGRRLFPGDGVILDEMTAKLNEISPGDSVTLGGISLPVTGIAREILFPVMYISPETSAKFGYDAPNCILLKLSPEADIRDVERQISEISDEAYFVKLSLQLENIRDGFVAMRTVMLMFAILAFGIGSLLIFNITIIDYNENRRQYATLRALGVSVSRLGRTAAMQNLFRVVPGILIACPLCRICVAVLLGLLSGASQQYIMVRYRECLILSCLIPLLYVLLGMGVAQSRIRKMDVCTALNETQ